MSNHFPQNHASVATTPFHKLPKISLEGSPSKQNFLSQVHLLLEAAVAASSVHLYNYLITSLARSSLFVFPSIYFFANSSTTIPCNSWENNCLIWIFPTVPHIYFSSFRQLITPPSPVSWQCPHLCISSSHAPVFILSSIGPSVSAFTHKQRLLHLLAGAFIFRVAAITGE